MANIPSAPTSTKLMALRSSARSTHASSRPKSSSSGSASSRRVLETQSKHEHAESRCAAFDRPRVEAHWCSRCSPKEGKPYVSTIGASTRSTLPSGTTTGGSSSVPRRSSPVGRELLICSQMGSVRRDSDTFPTPGSRRAPVRHRPRRRTVVRGLGCQAGCQAPRPSVSSSLPSMAIQVAVVVASGLARSTGSVISCSCVLRPRPAPSPRARRAPESR